MGGKLEGMRIVEGSAFVAAPLGGGHGAARGRRHPRRIAARLLGEHTDEVLTEVLGLSDAEIGRLSDRGVVAGVMAAPA
jgi:2-methylfumaryl-CoA isomerase